MKRQADHTHYPERDPRRYTALVWLIARQFAKRFPLYEPEELVGPATEGIIRACNSPDYDPSISKFITYASKCAWGNLRTYVRKESKQGFTGFPREFHNAPWRAGIRVHRFNHGDLDSRHTIPPEASKGPIVDGLADDTPEPAEAAARAEIPSVLAAALESLPEPRRSVVRMYYFDGLSDPEIGAVIGVSRSRVHKVREKALKTLRRDHPELSDLL